MPQQIWPFYMKSRNKQSFIWNTISYADLAEVSNIFSKNTSLSESFAHGCISNVAAKKLRVTDN